MAANHVSLKHVCVHKTNNGVQNIQYKASMVNMMAQVTSKCKLDSREPFDSRIEFLLRSFELNEFNCVW